MTLALQSMVEHSNKIGGIPSFIEMSSTEAKNLIEELKFISKEVPSGLAAFKFVNGQQKMNFERLRKINPLDTENEILSQWKNEFIHVEFMGIPLVIVEVRVDAEQYHEIGK